MAGRLILPPGTRFRDSDGYDVVVVDPRFASIWGAEYDVRQRMMRPMSDPYLINNAMIQSAHLQGRPIWVTYTTRRVTPLPQAINPPPPPPSGAGEVQDPDTESVDLTAGENLDDIFSQWEWEDANLQV